MFKRLLLISGIIAFLLACAMMWFWYLPRQEMLKTPVQTEPAPDTLGLEEPQIDM